MEQGSRLSFAFAAHILRMTLDDKTLWCHELNCNPICNESSYVCAHECSGAAENYSSNQVVIKTLVEPHYNHGRSQHIV